MMSFALGQLAHPLHEGKRFLKIAESKHALDAVGIIAQLPIRRLPLEAQCLISRQWRHAAATSLLREDLGHLLSLIAPHRAMLGARSAIDLPEDDVERADDRRDVGQHVPAA